MQKLGELYLVFLCYCYSMCLLDCLLQKTEQKVKKKTIFKYFPMWFVTKIWICVALFSTCVRAVFVLCTREVYCYWYRFFDYYTLWMYRFLFCISFLSRVFFSLSYLCLSLPLLLVSFFYPRFLSSIFLVRLFQKAAVNISAGFEYFNHIGVM